MAQKSASRAKSPGAGAATKKDNGTVQKPKHYGSHGVKDNDIFMLPGNDFYIMLALTALGAVVRLWRIAQPTSVVFDEVQYVRPQVLHAPTSFLIDCV
jgi:dolichyl-phosphate-mannose-protein mannosyltransferase